MIRQCEGQSGDFLQDSINIAVLAGQADDVEWRRHMHLNGARMRLQD